MNWQIRGCLIVALAIFGTDAFGSIDVSVDHPGYWSGTNCRAVGLAQISNGSVHVARTRMSLNQEVIYDQNFPIIWFPRPVFRVQDAPSVVFDSTHFDNGTELTLKLEAWDESGYHYETTWTAPVINRAVIFGRYDFEVASPFGANQKGIPTVRAACDLAKIENTFYVVTELGWPGSWFYNAMEEAVSVSYVHTHGESGCPQPNPPVSNPPATWLNSDLDELGLYPGEQPDWEYFIVPQSYGRSVQASRQLAVGTGPPPFNNTGQPPLWLAFNDGCRTGNDNAFAEAYLWPYVNAYNSNYCENQAQCGWSIYKSTDQTKPCMEAFWDHMADGWDADYARLRLYDAYDGANKPAGNRDLVHVYGDWYSRLHGVYTGEPGRETAWYVSGS